MTTYYATPMALLSWVALSMTYASQPELKILSHNSHCLTSIIQEWATILCAPLVLFSSYRDHDQNKTIISLVIVFCGIKGPRPNPTMTHHKLHHINSPWHHSPSMILYSSDDDPIFNNAGTHHPQGPQHQQELFQEVSSRKPSKVWASRILAQTSSSLVLTHFSLIILSFQSCSVYF